MSKLRLLGLACCLTSVLGASCGRSALWYPHSCGDGYVDPGEQCDDGNRVNGDGCDTTCQREPEPECGDGVLDPEFEECDDGNRVGGDGCDPACNLEPERECGNGLLEPGEECDDGNEWPGDGCDEDCFLEIPPSCGNGRLDSGEVCDDGNRSSGDGCSSDCLSQEWCGNGYLDWAIGEECDDGNPRDGDGCDSSCRAESPPGCGNGRIEDGEACDDGNRRSGDGCSGDCLSDETCGNGYVDFLAGEECDDGNTRPGDGCDAGCRTEVPPGCGNGVLESGETCDDGNRRSGDGCSGDCLSNERCGNGYLDWVIGEECDDGNLTPGDGCDEDCRREVPGCGNGRIDVGEECDDGNRRSGDGCSGDCLSDETCGNGYIDWAVGEECDDGNRIAGDGCDGGCRLEVAGCGNGRLDPGETCDDGNRRSGDGCSGDCLSDESCGNDYLDVLVGEECDDGNLIPGDGCDEDCQVEVPGCGNSRLDPGEVCDDGNTVGGDGCSADCLSDESCGNAYLDSVVGEVCDDGNTASGDGCSADCLSDESCGNGYLDIGAGEECDDGNRRDGDGCDMDCRLEGCEPDVELGTLPLGITVERILDVDTADDSEIGCGGAEDMVVGFDLGVPADLQLDMVQVGDHAFGLYSEGSGTTCTDGLIRCYDPAGSPSGGTTFTGLPVGRYYLVVEAFGTGDAGTAWIWLTALGEPPPDCGDGTLDAGEVCDDGNTVSGDGCSGDCLSNETCGNGYLDVINGEECDDGNTVSGDGCSADCSSDESCGNGTLDSAAGEICDDGNRRSGDGCSADCRSDETCGNGVIDTAVGESCDDGNTTGGDGCDAFCHVEAGLCYVDEDLGVMTPGVAVSRTLDVASAGDEWVTGCTSTGPDVVLTFELRRPGDIDMLFSQSGDHSMGLYTESEVTDVCTASGGVCFDRGPDESGEVIFMGRGRGTYYLIAEGQGPAWAGTVNVTLWVHGCAPDQDLGVIRAGASASTTVNTVAAMDIYEAGCAGSPTGNERVVAFELDGTRDVTLSWSQTGDHVMALMEEAGGECDEHQISCHDPTGATTGAVDWRRLAAGTYLVMVDAYAPGDEGSVSLTIDVR